MVVAMKFETKIAVVLRDDLERWQELNVTAFLVSGIHVAEPDVTGAPYVDADDIGYLPMFRQPVVVLQGPADRVRRAFDRARERGLPCAVYTVDLFKTGNDDDNRAAVRAVGTADLDVAGFAVYGDRKTVDKALDGLKLHP
jgi:hypothetical protein